ncbi:MAG: Gfo/Idh/MocA family oxidoreductase [Acidobacteria bacterium]|jgi:predicted dehydrogenase|nr:Gfo/Idh/MocA family oxidoreductase [Acidobacteriota bacterium]
MKDESTTGIPGLTRREVIKTASLASLAAAIPGGVFAAGTSERVKVGLIGCGGRGTGAAVDAVNASPDVVIAAMGDVFPDQLKWSTGQLKEKVPADRLVVTPETSFVGFDAYQKVLATDVDVVILATPPFFRPVQLKAAVEAGKHVFTEKPVAVDPLGVRSVIATSELAAKKGLSIVAGTQRRHQNHYLEIMKRVHDGDIGELVAGQCYWNMGALWIERAAMNWANRIVKNWSDMEWQIRNWLFTGWCGGDHIVEQHVHNLDVMNWAFDAHPVKCTGMGGRAARTDPMFGNIFDHFAVEYEYPNGARILSMCRQTAGASENVSERVVGTTGRTYTDSSEGFIEGARPWQPAEASPNPYVQEHADLIASIKAGKPLNEGRRVAESCLTAIMGRMSAYTGRALSWDWAMNASELDLTPPHMEFKELPPLEVPIPGQTPLV